MHAYQATAWFPAAAQGEVTIALDLRGCAKTTAGREPGFAEAVWLARDALERDAVDLAVVGAAESLVNDFVLRDWAGTSRCPPTAPRRARWCSRCAGPAAGTPARLGELRYTIPAAAGPGACWVPTLAAACRLHSAVAASEGGQEIAVALGGGYRAGVAGPATRI